jgi:NADH:ubiquinone oxidoreductase subunit E
MNGKKIGSALVVGGGIGGMQAALDLAEAGIKVFLVDKKPSIGGVMAQLDKTFPTNDCAMCTMAPRLVDIGRHKDIEILSLADIESIEGGPGNFKVSLRKKARYVNEDKCTGCGECVASCPVCNEIYTTVIEEVRLESEDLTKVMGILDRHKNGKSNLIGILQDISEEYMYLPEFILRYLALNLGIPLSRIYSIANFYSAFSLVPKGKHQINVCLGTACHVRGAKRIMEAVEKRLNIKSGETTEDMMFSLETVRCLGCCGLAPVVTIGEDVHGKTAPVKISSSIENIARAER